MLVGYQEGPPYPGYELRGAFSKFLLFESDVLKQSHKNRGKDDLEDISCGNITFQFIGEWVLAWGLLSMIIIGRFWVTRTYRKSDDLYLSNHQGMFPFGYAEIEVPIGH